MSEGESSLGMLPRSYITVRSARMRAVLRVQAEVCAAMRECLGEEGFLELLPPIIGPVTDPGARDARWMQACFHAGSGMGVQVS